MPLFKKKQELELPPPVEEEAPAPPPPPPGPHLLMDGPVLARWFLFYRLEQEVERAKRYGSCLSLLIAEPQVIARERVPEAQRLAAAEAANRSSRIHDLVGWLDEHRIGIILPEADAASARFAVTRMRDEMWVSSQFRGNQKWNVTLLDELPKIEELLRERPNADSAGRVTPGEAQAA
jgi:hypothetical protein